LTLKRVFKAFHYRDFRLQWIGACTSSIGTWMQQVAQSWLILEMSKSPFLLGLDAFLGQIPILLFSLVGGVVADRMDRRRLLLASQVVQLSCAFLIATLLYFKVLQVWHILSISFIVGTAQAFGGPAYQALIPSLVEPEDMPNAIALNSIQFNLARVIGPAVGGWTFTRFGYTWCFALNGLSFVAVIITLLMMNTKFIPKKSTESMLESMQQGFGFIRSQGAMVSLIALAFLMTFLGIPLLTFLPVIAKSVYHDADGRLFTTMMSVSGCGAIVGALVVAGMGNIKHRGRLALLILTVLGLTISGFALSQWLTLSMILIFMSGAALVGVFAMIASLAQLIATHEMRGRVMSVYNVAFRGGMPLGSLVCGWLVPMFTAPVVIAANGALLCLLGVYYLAAQRRVAAL
jgi:MFS family permease